MNVEKLRELELGSGLNLTDPPDPRSHKLCITRRDIRCDLSNVTVIKERGDTKYCQQVAPTWEAVQREMIRTIEEPDRNTCLNFGTHLQFSQSIDNIAVSKQILAYTNTFTEPTTSSEFEIELCTFLCHQLSIQSEDQQPSAIQKSSVSVINDYISTLNQTRNESHLQEITAACFKYMYIATNRVTHYVSAVQQGAMQYNLYSTSQYIESLGPGIGPMGGPLISGAISSQGGRQKLDKIEFKNAIGKMEGAEGLEAVIGISVQPVYMLVRQQDLREHMRTALRQYIHKASMYNVDSYLIAGVSETTENVYWTVNQLNQVMGTQLREQASSFQFQPAGTAENPSQFLIRYEKHHKDHNTLYYYVKLNANPLGRGNKPLLLTSEIGDRFTVHWPHTLSLGCLCTASIKTLQDWREADVLHLKGSPFSGCHGSGFAGMRPLESTNTHATYKTCCAPIIQKEDNCTRFCLVPDERAESQHEKEMK